MELTSPTVRARVHLAHTLKDGWRIDELTAEITGPLDHHNMSEFDTRKFLTQLLRDAHASGEEMLCDLTPRATPESSNT